MIIIDPMKIKGQHIWYLDDAIKFIREMDEQVRPFNYHLCLGGSVLMKGESAKDLDIYAMPFHNKITCDESSLILTFRNYAPRCESAFYADDLERADNLYIFRDFRQNKRIDLFVVKRQPNE